MAERRAEAEEERYDVMLKCNCRHSSADGFILNYTVALGAECVWPYISAQGELK